jgi:hypothetical protein
MSAVTVTESHICWECGGPCLQHKGSVHGWRCQACIKRHIEAGAVRGEAKALKARQKLLRAPFHNGSAPVDGGRQDGDGQALCRTAVLTSPGCG